MSRHCSDARQRRSKRYLAAHAELAGGPPSPYIGPVTLPTLPRVTYSGFGDDKLTRHRKASASFKQTAEIKNET